MRTLTQAVSCAPVLTLFLSLLTAGPAWAGTVYRVGPGCTYSTIQDAIDDIPSEGSGVIRIRGGTYSENVTIVDKTVDLLGGHADCTTTNNPGLTHIDASGGAAPAINLFVNGSVGSNYALTTDKLNLFGGTGGLLGPGGGISVYTPANRTSTVTLQRTFVRDSQTTYFGGGIALYGDGDGSLKLRSSLIENNTVTGDDAKGGGLYCQGDYVVLIHGGSINNNTAGTPGDSNGRGGGIYLDGCDMSWYAESSSDPANDGALRNNTVYGSGGGLYATGDAEVALIGARFEVLGGSGPRPLRIHNNLARGQNGVGSGIGRGSAVSAGGPGTRVSLDRTWVYGNDANHSGTFYAGGGAEIIVERKQEGCHHPRNCSRVFDNSARFVALASAWNGDSAIRFRHTIVSGNFTTNDSYLASMFSTGFGGTVEVDDSLVFGNTSYQLSVIDDNTRLRVRDSTVAGNELTNSIFRFYGESPGLTLWDSIIHEPGTDMAVIIGESDPQTTIDCVVWHDGQLGGTRTQVADPLFADPDNGLFYLQPGSPAINYCDSGSPAPNVDLDWNPRGETHGQPVLHGPYDLGAYEILPVIFEDRFETP